MSAGGGGCPLRQLTLEDAQTDSGLFIATLNGRHDLLLISLTCSSSHIGAFGGFALVAVPDEDGAVVTSVARVYSTTDGLTANAYANALFNVTRETGYESLTISITDQEGADDSSATFSSVSVLEPDPGWTRQR